MLGLVTCPSTPNKEPRCGEVQRKEIYYVALVGYGKSKNKQFSLSLGYSHDLKCKQRENLAGGERDA
jgi:hypothetical protein